MRYSKTSEGTVTRQYNEFQMSKHLVTSRALFRCPFIITFNFVREQLVSVTLNLAQVVVYQKKKIRRIKSKIGNQTHTFLYQDI